jgi:hypothetical protein
MSFDPSLFTGNNEWYTPAQYIKLARAVMGGIDIDPASNAIAQETVRASTYFSKDDCGLAKEWNGRIWLNPPYARGLISKFADKLLTEWRSGRCTQAIVLINNTTDTRWFHRLTAAATSICLTSGRIRFHRADLTPGGPPQGQTFLYFGPNSAKFSRIFGSIGLVAAPTPPPPKRDRREYMRAFMAKKRASMRSVSQNVSQSNL